MTTIANLNPFSKKNGPPVPAASNTPPTGQKSSTTTLLAWRSPQKNTRILIAYLPETDPTNPNNLVTVNVRDNFNFMPGMKLPARFVSKGVYDLEGPLPRYRGRW
jgi:hypothetical protein